LEFLTIATGEKLAFQHEGKGVNLVLVHGGFVDHAAWEMLTPILSQQFTVYVVDRIGHGNSDPYPTNATINTEAQAIGELIDLLDAPVYLVGHSSGGRVTLHTTQYTDKVKKLALYEPPEFQSLSDELKAQITEAEKNNDLEQLAWLAIAGVVGESTGEKPLLERLKKSPMWTMLYRNAASVPIEAAIYDSYQFDESQFADFDIPTMILLGSKSKGGFMQRSVESLNRSLPESLIVELEGQGHGAMFRNPQLLADKLLEFWGQRV